MKAKSSKSAAGRIASWSIVVLVLVGAVGICAVADLSEQSSFLSKAFVFFIGAVIVVQVIPGLMLFGAMVKGICGLAGKKAHVTVETDKK